MPGRQPLMMRLTSDDKEADGKAEVTDGDWTAVAVLMKPPYLMSGHSNDSLGDKRKERSGGEKGAAAFVSLSATTNPEKVTRHPSSGSVSISILPICFLVSTLCTDGVSGPRVSSTPTRFILCSATPLWDEDQPQL